ncbi:MAG TPA: CoA pyrophosphatase [Caulobacteraceae bacterium]|jgi:8-oxo-dGTP pyrophosphatase MutT (NUDIX family)|nr:CoA pyrophosphatase [Caulobacteraceae bacterium]
MSRKGSPAEFREWITGHLDPLDTSILGGMQVRGDLNLDPADATDDARVWTPAAVLVGLVEREHGYSVLLTRRADTLRNHTGQVAFPGGRCDPGETPWETALREAQEEIGLDPAHVELAGLSNPYRTAVTGYQIMPVVGFLSPDMQLTPSPAEVAEIFETPFGFLMDPSNLEPQERRGPNGDMRRFYAATWEGQYIWGATAGMLRALYDRLYGAAVA